MNLIEEFKKGQSGANKGLPMGEGLNAISRAVNGVQKGMLIGVGAAPKVGKSTFVDNGMVIEPYDYAKIHGIDLDINYFSYEIDRISKEFDFCAHYINKDFDITHIELENGQLYEGRNRIEISSKYFRGRLSDDEGNLISVKPRVKEALQTVYQNRIIPLFGEYSLEGKVLKKGDMNFLEHRENPTGIRNYLMAYAEKNGTFIFETFRDKKGKAGKKIIGYKPHNPNKHTIIVMDHLRKLLPERNFLMKQTVDKMVEYFVEFRNWCGWTIVGIIHLNRAMTETNRLRMYGDLLYPNGDDVKDTGNFSEECDHFFTMFNPNDDRYNLTKHFGEVIKDKHGNLMYPNMKTVHLVESRHVHFPQHFRVNMYGNVKKFEQLKI